MKVSMRKQAMVVLAVVVALAAGAGCGKKTTESGDDSSATEDSSASGAAAEAAGGALSGSGTNGTQAFEFRLDRTPSLLASLRSTLSPFSPAYAAASCPTFRTSGTGCTAGGSTLWLSYTGCSFGGPASWTGTQALTMSTGSAACGTFPNPGASGNLLRQFVSSVSSTTPGSVTLAGAGDVTGTIDDATANLGNFDGDTIAALANGGYGTKVNFNGSGARSSVTLAHHIYVSGLFDHSVTGTLTVTESSGASSRTLSGSISVYHNLVRVVGTSVFNGVTHTDTCCTPTAGSVTTTFAAGTNIAPTFLGQRVVGKSETLTFTGCGTATLLGTDGATRNVTLNRCF